MLAGFRVGRLIPRPMRPVICKCPNYTGCLLAYHSDDIEVTGDLPLVCPECGSALKRAVKPKSDAVYQIANFVGLLAVAGAIWYSWPALTKFWHKATTPPARTTPAKLRAP